MYGGYNFKIKLNDKVKDISDTILHKTGKLFSSRISIKMRVRDLPHYWGVQSLTLTFHSVTQFNIHHQL